MSRKDTILGVIAGGALIAAAVMTIVNLSGGGSDDGLNRASYWECRNPDCLAEFELTLAQYVKQSEAYDGDLPCPECEKMTTFRSSLCPHCAEPISLLAHGRFPDQCPECEQTIGMGFGQDTFHVHADGTSHSHEYQSDQHEHKGP